ncbi:uncharacterized protein SAPINGB_P003646 [Magnusiomyces paraingens]|uniref:Telomere length regulation protein conserved domain-containing protein n=1 Tax=Magnusiomyces paraingens TaxID=2606893 RepID=A0A5E8BRA4_9ASCO|nr:uncharacterized protein SAPINGB_P003646 [Saprochaete ingens]VVT53581.1 unnamed protein product [Saprochaete ingens]
MPIIQDISDIPEPDDFKDSHTLDLRSDRILENQSDDESWLTAIQTKKISSTPVPLPSAQQLPPTKSEAINTDAILEELRLRPSIERFIELITIFEKQQNTSESTTSPQLASVLATVLNVNLPDLYTQLDPSTELGPVLHLFDSLPGIASILAQIKTHLRAFLDDDSDTRNTTASITGSASSFLVDPGERNKHASAKVTDTDLRPTATKHTRVSDTLLAAFRQTSLLLDLLASMLEQPGAVACMYIRAIASSSSARRPAAFREVAAYIAGSRVYMLAAQCLTVFGRHPLITGPELYAVSWRWLCDPQAYQRFLVASLLDMLRNKNCEEAIPDFLLRGLRLHGSAGGPQNTVLLSSFIDPHNHELTEDLALQAFATMKPLDVRTVFSSYIIPYIYRTYLCVPVVLEQDEDENSGGAEARNIVGACADLLVRLVCACISPLSGDIDKQRATLESITHNFPAMAMSPQYSLGLRRVLVIVLDTVYKKFDYGEWQYLQIEELLAEWGKNMNIRHASLVAQHAQSELLVLWTLNLARGGYVEDAEFIKSKILESAAYLNAITNRLSSNSVRPRVLGMAVAETFSRELDKKNDAPLSFGVDEVYGADLDYFRKYLVGLNDHLVKEGSWWEVLEKNHDHIQPKKKRTAVETEDEGYPESNADEMELDDEDDNNDNGEFAPLSFAPEQDLDSDLEEEDLDDPSLNVLDKDKRNTKPPVYIKDLVAYLDATESFAKQKLGLETAAKLIEQKARYGKELQFYSKELATALVGMRNNFDIKQFEEQRGSALATLVAADPSRVGPHLSVLLVTGDYSALQRTVVLSGLASGAEILANSKTGAGNSPVFASRKLPSEALHKLFLEMDEVSLGGDPDEQKRLGAEGYSGAHLKTLTYEMQQELLGGTTERAQEQLVGAARELRVSGSLEKQRKEGTVGKLRPSGVLARTNVYAKTAARSFFLPLAGNWQRVSGSSSSSARGTPYFGMFLAQVLRTLAVLLYLAAPGSTELTEMSGVLLEIVMAQRARGLRGAVESGNENAQVYEDLAVREGLYTAILAIVQIAREQDGGEALVSRWPQEVVELKLWVEEMWENHEEGVGGGSSIESATTLPASATGLGAMDYEARRVRGLAASAVFMVDEIVEKWQRRLVGELVSPENSMKELRIERTGVLGGQVRIR